MGPRPPWRSQSVFVTSTFQDMQAERDYLLACVFPAVEEWLASKHRHLEWIDLRVGAADAGEDETTREAKILSVCLDEVRRARPFVIALVGDRYGWTPPAARATAAAREIGFDTDAAGRSVTDLEIDFGILHDTAPRRGLVFLREPLPYDDMPPDVAAVYSDEYARDAGAPARVLRLAQLKARLRRDAPDRCFDYRAGWDRQTERVTGLEAWGQSVEARLREALEQEFGGDAGPVERSWEEIDADALATFIEERTRGFVGRHGPLSLIERLLDTGPAEPRPWGACIAGEPGAGKTALFGEIARRLIARQDQAALVLVHAVAAGTRGSLIDVMLRRFLHDLVTHPDSINWFRFTESGEIVRKDVLDAGLAPNAADEQLYAALGLLVSWAAEVRHVVVLVDALDQVDELSQAKFVAWVGRHWPRKARLIVTTQPTPAAAAFRETAGVLSLPLGPLDEEEARDITAEICGRYHRRLSPAVTNAIIARRRGDGPAWSLPLWLVIAAEQLNLLDADDFARARREYPGGDEERIAAMMADLVAAMPADVHGLYRTVIARAERAFGRRTVAAFLGAIAVSRFGWRDTDFRAVMPGLSGDEWDDLRFATLRRLFRGHLRLRQPLGRWDFVHRQLRVTVRRWLSEIGVDARGLHAAIADHLLVLPAADPLRVSETMAHLLEAEDWTGAATYLGRLQDDDPAREGALAILVQALRAPSERPREEFARRLTRLLDAPDLDDETIARVASELIDVHFRSQGRSSLTTERTLMAAIDEALRGLVARRPRDRALLLQHARCLRFLGHMKQDGGDLEAALDAFREAEALGQRANALLEPSHPEVGEPAGDGLSVGDALFARGDLHGALERYRRAATRGSSAASGRVGVVLRLLGDFNGALAALRQGLALLEREIATNPRSQPLRFSLGIAHSSIASTLADKGDLDAALESYGTAMDLVAHIAALNPLDPHVQSQWAEMHLRIADVHERLGDAASALAAIRQGKPIVERLVAEHGDNPHYWRDAALFELKWGDLASRRGEANAALERWRTAERIFDRLAAHDQTNAEWRRDLAVTLMRLGPALQARGEPQLALAAWRRQADVLDWLVARKVGGGDWPREREETRAAIAQLTRARTAR